MSHLPVPNRDSGPHSPSLPGSADVSSVSHFCNTEGWISAAIKKRKRNPKFCLMGEFGVYESNKVKALSIARHSTDRLPHHTALPMHLGPAVIKPWREDQFTLIGHRMYQISHTLLGDFFRY